MLETVDLTSCVQSCLACAILTHSVIDIPVHSLRRYSNELFYLLCDHARCMWSCFALEQYVQNILVTSFVQLLSVSAAVVAVASLMYLFCATSSLLHSQHPSTCSHCTCRLHAVIAHAGCMQSLHMQAARSHCTCRLHAVIAHAGCTQSLHMQAACSHCTCRLHAVIAHTGFTQSLHMQAACSHCTCRLYVVPLTMTPTLLSLSTDWHIICSDDDDDDDDSITILQKPSSCTRFPIVNQSVCCDLQVSTHLSLHKAVTSEMEAARVIAEPCQMCARQRAAVAMTEMIHNWMSTCDRSFRVTVARAGNSLLTSITALTSLPSFKR